MTLPRGPAVDKPALNFTLSPGPCSARGTCLSVCRVKTQLVPGSWRLSSPCSPFHGCFSTSSQPTPPQEAARRVLRVPAV